MVVYGWLIVPLATNDDPQLDPNYVKSCIRFNDADFLPSRSRAMWLPMGIRAT